MDGEMPIVCRSEGTSRQGSHVGRRVRVVAELVVVHNIITYDNTDNKDLRVASRSGEVQTNMNSQVTLLCLLRLLLPTHVGLMLISDKV